MVQCAAFNCNNKSGSGQKKGLYSFPRDTKLRAVWVAKLKRDGFTPTTHSRLCADHFEPECFTKDPRLLDSIGFQPKLLRLISDAVPTLFNFSATPPRIDRTAQLDETPIARKRSKTPSSAVLKRRRLQILAEIHVQSNHESEPEETNDLMEPIYQEGQQRGHVSLQVKEVAPRMKSCGMQVSPVVASVATQSLRHKSRNWTHLWMIVMYHLTVLLMIMMLINDPDWQPMEDDEQGSDDCEQGSVTDFDGEETEPDKANKYIVFEQSLFQLLDMCSDCGRSRLCHTKTLTGSCLNVLSVCECGFGRQWSSQPFNKAMPWGNLTIASALFFSGNSPVKTFNFLKNANIAGLSLTSYNKLQRTYIVPSILSVWQSKQETLLHSIRSVGRDLKLGGDARCSSPGHTANYGSYTLMGVQTNKVIDIQLVQSNEVKNSYGMEL